MLEHYKIFNGKDLGNALVHLNNSNIKIIPITQPILLLQGDLRFDLKQYRGGNEYFNQAIIIREDYRCPPVSWLV